MKKVFCFICVGLAVGAAAAATACFLKYKKKTYYDLGCISKEADEEKTTAHAAVSTDATKVQDEPVYEDIKQSAIGSVYSRHEDAAVIMKDSIVRIQENTKAFDGTNNEINAVSAELDKMLSEDY